MPGGRNWYPPANCRPPNNRPEAYTMTRPAIALLVVSVVSAPADAQYRGNFPLGGSQFVPSMNPFYYVPRYTYTEGFNLNVPGAFAGYSRTYSGINRPGYYYLPGPSSFLAPPAGYLSGGVGGRNTNAVLEAAERNFGRAQGNAMQARADAARARVAGQWDYETGNRPATPAAPPLAPEAVEALNRALATVGEDEVATGDPLNQILTAAAGLTAKGATAPSGFLAPNLLSEVRFAGGPSADALNLLRGGSRTPLPAALAAAPLTTAGEAVEKALAGVAAATAAGKQPEQTVLATLDAAVEVAQTALTPAVRDLEFEDATAARRYLNHAAAVAKVMRDPAARGLFDPKWPTEGTSAADLVAHMTKFKLRFAPADAGADEAYLALHRNLATYLFTLSQNAPGRKK